MDNLYRNIFFIITKISKILLDLSIMTLLRSPTLGHKQLISLYFSSN